VQSVSPCPHPDAGSCSGSGTSGGHVTNPAEVVDQASDLSSAQIDSIQSLQSAIDQMG
jgi:hypothetical protein